MIQTVVQEMIEALIQHKPQNVPLFMRNWLLKRAKVTSTGLSEAEREELSQLRVDVIRYRKEEGEVSGDEESDDSDGDGDAYWKGLLLPGENGEKMYQWDCCPRTDRSSLRPAAADGDAAQ